MKQKEALSLCSFLKRAPFTHQEKAFDFACAKYGLTTSCVNSDGVALLMEMGTGKTAVAIGVTGALNLFANVHRVLVVCPVSVMGVWEQEFDKFASFPYHLQVLKGGSKEKKQALQMKKDAELSVFVVNYESTWRIQDALMEYDADFIVCDESQKIKTSDTKQARCMHVLGDMANYKMILTGTMITNREIDVYSQYRFLNTQIFGTDFLKFRKRYFFMGGYGFHTPYFRQYMRQDFTDKIQSVAFCVTKEECLDLPEEVEDIRFVDLEAGAMKKYRLLKKNAVTEFEGKEVTTNNILTKLIRLSQLTGGYITDDSGNITKVSSAKLATLEDIVDTVIDGGKKIVIIARFLPEIVGIKELLEKKDIRFSCITGAVKDRMCEVERFQNDPECKVFLGQIATAGLGISLTAASTMVFYSLDYSMANFEQCKARIHRATQKNVCHDIFLIARDTVDIKVVNALRSKVDVLEQLHADIRNGKDPFEAESAN